jgi:hypothetical protein
MTEFLGEEPLLGEMGGWPSRFSIVLHAPSKRLVCCK